MKEPNGELSAFSEMLIICDPFCFLSILTPPRLGLAVLIMGEGYIRVALMQTLTDRILYDNPHPLRK